jgi:hypothetical protein
MLPEIIPNRPKASGTLSIRDEEPICGPGWPLQKGRKLGPQGQAIPTSDVDVDVRVVK